MKGNTLALSEKKIKRRERQNANKRQENTIVMLEERKWKKE